jgi:hypothetical protein
MIAVLRQTFAVTTHVSAGQVKYAHTEALDALNLSFNVGY